MDKQNMVYHITEYEVQAVICMNLKNMPNKRSQTQETTYYMIPFE